jgi:hypothetical protein
MLYRAEGCTGCEACVDAQGWRNMGSVSIYFVTYKQYFSPSAFQFAAVHTFKCFVADAAGCSDAFSCSHH